MHRRGRAAIVLAIVLIAGCPALGNTDLDGTSETPSAEDVTTDGGVSISSPTTPRSSQRTSERIRTVDHPGCGPEMTDLPPIALTPESTIEFASRCEAARIRGATRHTNASVLARGPDSVLVRASVRLGRPGNTVAGFYRFTIGGFRRVSAALVRRAGNLHSPVGNATLRVYVLNFAPQSADPRLVIEALDTDTPAPILDREYELTAMSGGRHAPADRPPGRYRATLEPTTETPQRSVVPLEAGDHGVVMVVIEPGGQTTLLTDRRTRD